jgi:hypothetical protein
MTNAAKVTRNPGRPALVHDPLPLFVKHPRERSWCGYQELMGMRRQYRILDSERLLVLLGKVDMGNFRRNYVAMIEERIAQDRMQRAPQWTECVAVGSKEFCPEH